MAKKYDNLSSAMFENVSKQSQSKAMVVVVRNIPDDKLVDYPKNGEDISHTEDIELSIAEQGFTDPMEVTPYGQPDGYYMILSGHRRRRAGRNMGMTEFPCIVKDHFKNDGEIENYVLMANAQRNSERDPLLIVNRSLKHAKYLKEQKAAGNFKGSIREEVAKRIGVEVKMADRYLKMEHVISPVWDMIREGKTSATAVNILGSRPVDVQEGIFSLMCAADEAGIYLSEPVVKALTRGWEAGYRTWEACLTKPEQTKENEIPMDAPVEPVLVNDTPGKPEVETPEPEKEIIEESGSAEVEEPEVTIEEVAEEEIIPEPEEEKPTPRPAPSEDEIRMKNGEAIFKAMNGLTSRFNDFYSFPSAVEAEKAIDTMEAVVRALMEEICNISNDYKLQTNGKDSMKRICDDATDNLEFIK